MNKNRIIKLAGVGLLSASAAIVAQRNIPQLPAPSEARPNFGRVVDRPDGAMPKAPTGFTVELYADNVPGARMMEFAPNGDLFVSQPAQNAVMVLRDANKDGKPEERFTFRKVRLQPVEAPRALRRRAAARVAHAVEPALQAQEEPAGRAALVAPQVVLRLRPPTLPKCSNRSDSRFMMVICMSATPTALFATSTRPAIRRRPAPPKNCAT